MYAASLAPSFLPLLSLSKLSFCFSITSRIRVTLPTEDNKWKGICLIVRIYGETLDIFSGEQQGDDRYGKQGAYFHHPSPSLPSVVSHHSTFPLFSTNLHLSLFLFASPFIHFVFNASWLALLTIICQSILKPQFDICSAPHIIFSVWLSQSDPSFCIKCYANATSCLCSFLLHWHRLSSYSLLCNGKKQTFLP